MQLITAFELATRNEAELRALFREVSGVLIRTDGDWPERRIGLASLENIATAIRSRVELKPWPEPRQPVLAGFDGSLTLLA